MIDIIKKPKSEKKKAKSKTPAFVVNNQPISGSFWQTIVNACNGDLFEAAKCVYRAKGARSVCGYIRKGMKDGYIFKNCLDEDRKPKAVQAWCDKVVFKVVKQDTRKMSHRGKVEGLGASLDKILKG